MKSFQVIRTDLSPYHGPNFEQIERDRLGNISGIQFEQLSKADISRPTILITNTHTELKKLPPKLLHNTKLILHSNSGYDHFAHEAALWKNIPLVVGHEIRAQAVAEYSLSALFEGLIELPQHLMWSKSRNWERPLIKDQEAWVFGYGHIGKIVASTLRAIGAKVTVVDPYLDEIPTPKNDHSEARIVIACCSLNSSTRSMFNEKFFNRAHPELIFINGARGKLVEERALREFLLSHPKAQAFLDVFEHEPFNESWHHFPQVWKTSHIAGVYSGLDEGVVQFEEKTLKDFIFLEEIDFFKKYSKELLQNKWVNGELI
jgi:phosphoglycerate dehydrogenase-like enzyme